MDGAIVVYQREPVEQEILPPDHFRDLTFAFEQMAAALTDFGEAIGNAMLELDSDIIDAEFTEIEP